MKQTPNGWYVMRLHYSADPTMVDPETGEWTERCKAMRATYTSEAFWNQEMEIMPDALSGMLVYPEFDKYVHVVPDAMIPTTGCRYMSIDPHPRTPHAMLWVLIDKWNDWWVYRDFWPSKAYGNPENIKDRDKDNDYIVKWYAETIAMWEGNELTFSREHHSTERAMYRQKPSGEKIIRRYMDQAGKGFRVSAEDEANESIAVRYARYGIRCVDPVKTHSAGIDAVKQLLIPRKQSETGKNWPRLHIAESCKELILEFTKLRFQSSRVNPERELKQKPIEARRHQLDNLRYLAISNASYVHGMAS